MSRKSEAPAVGLGRGRQTPRGEAFLSCPPQYSRPVAVCQADLSRLLDQALTLAERHEAEAWRSWQLARKHRRIKAAFEGLAKVRA